MIKSFEDFQTLSKDGYEAFVASGTALTKGFQAIAQEATDFSRKSFEKGTEVVRQPPPSPLEGLGNQQGYAKELTKPSLLKPPSSTALCRNRQGSHKPFEASLAAFGIKAK
jgi:hypothetical protein